ncbi:MAG: hypothetical protein QOF13_1085, partial [Solirubrobacterales bacterium]|nr:hypothetical protein [Solirubrobacterales bacterium]
MSTVGHTAAILLAFLFATACARGLPRAAASSTLDVP